MSTEPTAQPGADPAIIQDAAPAPAYENPPRPVQSSYDDLKPQIRQDYETTDASVRSIAARYGLRSDNTIRRWVEREGWKKDIHRITASLVSHAVAMDPDKLEALRRASATLYRPPTLDHEPDANTTQASTPPAPPPPPPPIPTEPPPRRVSDRYRLPRVKPQPVQLDEHGIPIHPHIVAEPPGSPTAPGTPAHTATATPDARAQPGTAGQAEAPPLASAARIAEKSVRNLRLPSPFVNVRSLEGVDNIEDDQEDSSDAHTAHGPEQQRARASAQGAQIRAQGPDAHDPVALRDALREREEQRDIDTAQTMAVLQARAIRKQMGAADRLIDLSSNVLAIVHVATMILPDDASEEDHQAQARAVQRLTSINPAKETIAGLLNSAVAVMKTGVSMQRKAMGMDTPAAPGEAGGGEQLGIKARMQALERLPTELLAKLRDASLAQSRVRVLPNATRAAAVAGEGGGEGQDGDG